MTGDVITGRTAVALFWECRGDVLNGSAVFDTAGNSVFAAT